MNESGSPQPPPVADRYRLLQRLGTGASGEVFEAEDLRTGLRLAVKLLFPHVVRHQPNQFRFDRQWELLQEIDHPNIVRLWDAGWCEHRQTQFAAMERLEGVTFSDHLGPLATPIGQLIAWIQDALQGLAAAHRAGLVHRDIKPDNLFVRNESPRVKLIDFGLVRAVDVTGPTQTQMGLGTPSYMAPEQATSARSVTQAADVWSMGVLIYRVLSGRVPFVGEGPYEIMIKVMTTEHPPLDGVPAPLRELVDRCLAKDPDDRPRDAGVLAHDLEGVLRDPAVAAWLAAAGPSRATGPEGPELPAQVGGPAVGSPASLPAAGPPEPSSHPRPPALGVPPTLPASAAGPMPFADPRPSPARPAGSRILAVGALLALLLGALALGTWSGVERTGSPPARVVPLEEARLPKASVPGEPSDSLPTPQEASSDPAPSEKGGASSETSGGSKDRGAHEAETASGPKPEEPSPSRTSERRRVRPTSSPDGRAAGATSGRDGRAARVAPDAGAASAEAPADPSRPGPEDSAADAVPAPRDEASADAARVESSDPEKPGPQDLRPEPDPGSNRNLEPDSKPEPEPGRAERPEPERKTERKAEAESDPKDEPRPSDFVTF